MFVIAGVSGQTGAATANALLERGAPVTVVVRDAAKGEPWRARGAKVAVADLTDAKALAAALRGAAGAYLLGPPDWISSDPLGEAHRFAATLAQAVRESDVAHVVVLSSIGAQLPAGTGAIGRNRALETEFANVDRPITFVRAAAFIQNQGTVVELARTQGILPSFLQPLDQALEMVDVADVGRAAADALIAGPRGARRIIELAGPQKYSPNDVAVILARLYGRDVIAVAPPREQWAGILAQTGASPQVADIYMEMFEGINSGHVRYEHPETVVRGGSTLDVALTRDYGNVAVAN